MFRENQWPWCVFHTFHVWKAETLFQWFLSWGLKCDNARVKAAETLGKTFEEFKRRVRDDDLANSIATMLWEELVYPCALRDADREVFEVLPSSNVDHEEHGTCDFSRWILEMQR